MTPQVIFDVDLKRKRSSLRSLSPSCREFFSSFQDLNRRNSASASLDNKSFDNIESKKTKE